MRGLILLNPASGAGKGGRALPAVRELAQRLEIDLVETEFAGQATILAREAVRVGRPLVVAAGGDDTVREVLHGMFYRGSPLWPETAGLSSPPEVPMARTEITALGIIPLGTFNNFATYLNLPWDPIQALEIAHAGRTAWVDLGRLEDGTIFTESVGVGLNVEAWLGVTVEAAGMLERLWQGLLSFARAFYAYQPKRLQVRLDGKPLQLKVMDLTVANSSHFASGIAVAPNAVIDDGNLDVCILPPMSKLAFLAAVPLFMLGAHPRLPAVRYSYAREVRISASRPHPVRVDGKVMRRLPVTIEVLPRALPVRLRPS